MGKSGSVSCGPFSWALVHTRCFICALQEFVPLVLCKFWWPCGGVNGDLLQEGVCYTQVCCTQSSCCCSRPLLAHTSAGDTRTLKGRSGSVSGGSPGMHKFCLSSLTGMGFYSKRDFTPPTILLRLLLCPLMLGLSFWWDLTVSCCQLFSNEL